MILGFTRTPSCGFFNLSPLFDLLSALFFSFLLPLSFPTGLSLVSLPTPRAADGGLTGVLIFRVCGGFWRWAGCLSARARVLPTGVADRRRAEKAMDKNHTSQPTQLLPRLTGGRASSKRPQDHDRISCALCLSNVSCREREPQGHPDNSRLWRRN
ncbi:hypothetical protein B0J18DRAFT_94629 [Chaetomium sp. MPI-SDFR-AT-0129]|nr:hypothetical protein B0J18DRAFT_94629 [Chaetomium sp. MPI-SDFR-AT-0129]